MNAPATKQPVAHNSLWQRAVLLTRKELRETLRDRRTIITLLAMPVMLYPLLGLTFRMLAVNQFKQKDSEPRYAIALGTDVEALWLSSAVQLGDQLLAARKRISDNEKRARQEAASDGSVASAGNPSSRGDTETDASATAGQFQEAPSQDGDAPGGVRKSRLCRGCFGLSYPKTKKLLILKVRSRQGKRILLFE